MSFPRYPKYKDSGVEWLGEVPEDWNALQFGRLLVANEGGAWGGDPDGVEDSLVLRSTEQTELGTWQLDAPCVRKLRPSEREATLLRRDDLLVTKSSGSAAHIGKTTLVTGEIAAMRCGFSNFMQRLRVDPSKLLPKLAWFVLNSRLSRFQFDSLSTSTSGLANITAGVLDRIVFPLGNLDEQACIVQFLEKETAKIDALIEQQRRLIELLKENRQAAISHAVTKGLDPKTSLRDSGIEWLAKIPAHWSLIRVADLYRETKEQGTEGLPILSVSIHHGVSDKELEDDELERVVNRSEDVSKYKRVHPGDLTYNMMRAWQGAFGAVLVEGMVSPAYVVARPTASIDSNYVERVLRTPSAIREMKRYSKGVTDFRLRLYWEEFKNIRIPVPPMKEQAAILHWVEELETKTGRLVQQAEQNINLLQERRSALISAAVAGKIDVRNYVSPLATAVEEICEPA